MIDKTVMIALLLFYVALAMLATYQRKMDLALYWTGAIVLNLGVLRMAY